MADSSQDAIIAFLASPEAFDGRAPVSRIDTHFSVVTMAGDRVLKLKRALANDLLDYSTVEKRHEACLAELRINRRSAPDLYRSVLPITRDGDGRLQLGGDGEPLDWVVAMRRFDEGGLFLDMAHRGELSDRHIDGAADAVARLHGIAEATVDHGGLADMRWVIEGNNRALADTSQALLDRAAVAGLAQASQDALACQADLLEQRRREGNTRRCHGDLHLGNICLVDGDPTLFDAIEFNDRIACCDPLYDLAFLVMDLWARGHRDHANRALNRYLWRTADWQGLPLLPLFLSCRAAVRAKTSIWAADVQEEAEAAARLRDEAAAYLALALEALRRPPCSLLALGGLSGSGKTTLAMALAPQRPGIPGALIVRSDVVRKQLAGVAFEERLGHEAYGPGTSAQVYGQIEAVAARALDSGLSVIADAVFLRQDERDSIAGLAGRSGGTFAALWLEAPRTVLHDRVGGRRGDASDADAAVVDLQSGHDTGTVTWPRIDTRDGPQAAVARARQAL